MKPDEKKKFYLDEDFYLDDLILLNVVMKEMMIHDFTFDFIAGYFVIW